MRIDWLRLNRDPNPAPAAAAPAAAPANIAPASAAATVDINAVPPAKPSDFKIPDAFKDKTYLKGIDSPEKLYQLLDNSQTLIGKKGVIIPGPDAPQAEKDAYYEALGRPKTPEEYAFDGADKSDPEFVKGIRGIMHKHGVSKEVASAIWKDATVEMTKVAERAGTLAATLDVDFEKLAGETFGAEREKVLARGKELIEANISPAMKPAVGKLDNNALIVLADILRNMDKKYIKQDGAPNAQPAASGSTVEELRAKARLIMEKQSKVPALSQEFNTMQKEIDGIYDQMRRGQR